MAYESLPRLMAAMGPNLIAGTYNTTITGAKGYTVNVVWDGTNATGSGTFNSVDQLIDAANAKILPTGSYTAGGLSFDFDGVDLHGSATAKPSNYLPQDVDVSNAWLDEPLIPLLNLPSPYAPALSREHAYLGAVYFESAFNGYHFWAVGNPYPASDSTKENSCIYVSQDAETWIAAPGVTNPVFGPPATGAYADSTLVISPDKKTLYLVWIWDNGTIGGVANTTAIMGSSSTDGINWTTPVVLFSALTASGNAPDAPSLVWANSKWTIIYHYGVGTGVRYVTNAMANPLSGAWAAPAAVTITHPLARAWWHSHFIALPSGKIIGFVMDGANTGGNLYAATSTDGGVTFGVSPFTYQDINAIANYGVYYKATLCLIGGINPGLLAFFGQMSQSATGSQQGAIWIQQKARLNFKGGDIQSKLASIADMVNRQIKPGNQAIVYDSFNRAGAATAGTADSGQAWAGFPTMFTGSGTTLSPNAANSQAWINITPGDFYAEVQLVTIGTSIFLTFNHQSYGNFWAWGTQTGGSGKQLLKVVGGVVVANYGYSTNGRLSAGDTIGVARKGGFILLYVNRQLVDCIYDTTGANVFSIGFQGNSTPVNSVLDNFFVLRGGI